MREHIYASRPWVGKVSAAVIPGFALALAGSVALRELAGVGDAFVDAGGQIAMWSVAPLWAMLLSFCFLFRSGVQAWLSLCGGNLLVWATILLVRSGLLS